MKKMMIVVAVVAMAFGACGKKKDAAAPTAPTEAPAEAAPAEGAPAEGAPAEGGEAAPAEGGGM